MRTKPILLSAFLLLFSFPSFGQDFDKGWDAVQRGDYEKALKEWRPLADQKHPDALFNIGLLYMKGLGVSQSYSEAAEYFIISYAEGHPDAALNLAQFYRQGLGVQKDPKEAFKWFKRAAEQGDVEGQYNVAVSLDKGDGVTKNAVAAFKWFRLSAINGHLDAQYNLGLKYALGEGVTQNLQTAFVWWTILRASEGESMQRNLDILGKKMTFLQRKTAEKIAKRCLKQGLSTCTYE